MKKAIFSLAFLTALVATADTYLYWMIGNVGDYSGYAYAKIKDTSNNSYLNLYYEDIASIGTQVSESTINSYQTANHGLYAALAGCTAGTSSFVIELYNDQDVFMAQSESLSYTDPSIYVAHFVSGSIEAPAQMWAPTSYAVPEPNSALLLMLGFAVLGLKRKTQKV